MIRPALAISALLAFSATAFAADLGWNNTAAPSSNFYSPASVTDWSGFYAGVSGGYSWGTTNVRPAIVSNDNNSSGWNFGAQAGYNVDLGGLVVGAEGDLSLSSLGYNEPAPGAAGTFESKLDMFGTVRARAGATFGQVMPYATLGVAFGRGTTQVTNNGVATSQSATHFGWTAGLGIEAKATENISVKAEYLYVDLGNQNYSGVLGGRDVGHRFSVIRAGVNYHF